ncbi:serine/threonine-protein kinase [Streptomyces sp. SDT5-1]|uniref:serine/threonine-protein kinase n=1 Tax=Streptomyces sp. SDT5-1 TaxID=3406418 RepID=UPI003FD3E422
MAGGADAPDTLAGRYRLQVLLGRGTSGEVWRASDEVLCRPVAVKLLRGDGPSGAHRFHLEARTAARLNHPNLVGVYDFGSDGDRLFLVTEYVDGWSLAQERTVRATLPPAEATGIAAQIAAGLAAAHRRGVVHRDIKPANVLLTTERTAKIVDFGIARFTDTTGTLTATGKILGTADYLAPERAQGYDARPASDLYSLGCLLYQLLTGRAPFTGATSVDVVRQHVDSVPASPRELRPELPRALSDYVMRLLAKDPAGRPTAEQAAEWLAGGGAEPVAADGARRSDGARAGAHSRPRGYRKRATKAAVYGVGVVLLTSAAALGSTLHERDAEPSRSPEPTPFAVPSAHPTASPPGAP